MSFEYSKLLGKIKENFGSQLKFSKALGLSEHSLSLKINNKLGWKQSEILKTCKLLKIDVRDIHTYFFTENVQ